MTKGRETMRFRGRVAGFGSPTGIRVVVAHWRDTPLGPFSDALVTDARGHRTIIAPHGDAGRFLAATYDFEEIRIEPIEVSVDGAEWRFRSDSLNVDFRTGRRTWIGWILIPVPRFIAVTRWWSRVLDFFSRKVLPGVRARGETRGRDEWHGAFDNIAITEMSGTFDDVEIGPLAPLDPPAGFGYSSPPKQPSVTELASVLRVVRDW